MYLLGIDIGTSSIKVSVVHADTQQRIITVQYPEKETAIISTQKGWAEQRPQDWWENSKIAIKKANASGLYNPKDISSIGIAYQMHGLVIVDKNQQVLRNSIIWCDSRAVEIGDKAFKEIGETYNLQHHLNSPGNFTASKLAWVKQHEPLLYEKVDKCMLPGDYLAMELTGEITTSISALSEGIFWDFKTHQISTSILAYYGFDKDIIPQIKPVFSNHGTIKPKVAEELGLNNTVKVTYKSGDQPNNALSLNVFEPGEVAATAGTSGVIYAVSDKLIYDNQSRINTFAHVNYEQEKIRTGVLLCINGTGILNSWGKKLLHDDWSYSQINSYCEKVKRGSDGLRIIPFGNGAERMLNNKLIGAQISGIDLNSHESKHILRAIQEGIAFSFRYGLDIMRENGLNPICIKAGHSNLFLSEVFRTSFVGTTKVPIELYDNDGSIGSALGAGIGSSFYKTSHEAFCNLKPKAFEEPTHTEEYEACYQEWKEILDKNLNEIN